MILRKYLLAVLCCTAVTCTFAQSNLLDPTPWVDGDTGNATGYEMRGNLAENYRQKGIGPFGDPEVVLWVADPDGSSGADGGIKTDYVNLPTDGDDNTYRFSVWVKKTNSQDGLTYFGIYGRIGGSYSINDFSNNNVTYPYFWYGDLPELDKWYLLVGYVHPANYSGGTLADAGLYDGETLLQVTGVTNTDFKMAAGTEQLLLQAFLNSDTNTNDLQYFWNPTMYEVNGQEPSITEMLNQGGGGTTGGGTGTGGYWTQTGTDIHYNSGNVGIGTTNIGSWELAVGGKIRAEEVKVETGWADYVFNDDYELPTLEEVEKHIAQKGHLINIPSAQEVEANGILLGDMNRLLLEKIEELTLYILQQEDRIKQLEETVSKR